MASFPFQRELDHSRGQRLSSGSAKLVGKVQEEHAVVDIPRFVRTGEQSRDGAPARDFHLRRKRLVIVGVGKVGGELAWALSANRSYMWETIFAAVASEPHILEHFTGLERFLVDRDSRQTAAEEASTEWERLGTMLDRRDMVIIVGHEGEDGAMDLIRRVARLAAERGVLVTQAMVSLAGGCGRSRREARNTTSWTGELCDTLDVVLVVPTEYRSDSAEDLQPDQRVTMRWGVLGQHGAFFMTQTFGFEWDDVEHLLKARRLGVIGIGRGRGGGSAVRAARQAVNDICLAGIDLSQVQAVVINVFATPIIAWADVQAISNLIRSAFGPETAVAVTQSHWRVQDGVDQVVVIAVGLDPSVLVELERRGELGDDLGTELDRSEHLDLRTPAHDPAQELG
jgi:cell division GTPase FtsZ